MIVTNGIYWSLKNYHGIHDLNNLMIRVIRIQFVLKIIYPN